MYNIYQTHFRNTGWQKDLVYIFFPRNLMYDSRLSCKMHIDETPCEMNWWHSPCDSLIFSYLHREYCVCFSGSVVAIAKMGGWHRAGTEFSTWTQSLLNAPAEGDKRPVFALSRSEESASPCCIRELIPVMSVCYQNTARNANVRAYPTLLWPE